MREKMLTEIFYKVDHQVVYRKNTVYVKNTTVIGALFNAVI